MLKRYSTPNFVHFQQVEYLNYLWQIFFINLVNFFGVSYLIVAQQSQSQLIKWMNMKLISLPNNNVGCSKMAHYFSEKNALRVNEF